MKPNEKLRPDVHLNTPDEVHEKALKGQAKSHKVSWVFFRFEPGHSIDIVTALVTVYLCELENMAGAQSHLKAKILL
jgi:hypothetical protein